MRSWDAGEVAIIAIFTALALVLHLVENLLPAWGPPGAKLGLANIAAMLLLTTLGLRAAVWVTILRVILGTIFAGTFISLGFWLGMSGGLASILVMGLLFYLVPGLDFKLLGVAGAVTHNSAQIAVAYFFIGYGAFYYLPLLLLLAIPAGLLTGTIAGRTYKPLHDVIGWRGHHE